jgi:hypothetical protein
MQEACNQACNQTILDIAASNKNIFPNFLAVHVSQFPEITRASSLKELGWGVQDKKARHFDGGLGLSCRVVLIAADIFRTPDYACQ